MTFDEVLRRARYGHKDWLVWNNRSGVFCAARLTAESLKQCLLDCGTARKWTIVSASTAILHRGFWWLGINMLRSIKGGHL